MLRIIQTRKIFFSFSTLMVVLSILALLVFGLKPGIDFTGGSLMELTFTKERPALSLTQETIGSLNFGSALVQPSGENGYIIKLRFISEEEHQRVLDTFRDKFENEENKVMEERIETIGPAFSSLLKKRSWSAGLAVIVAIVLYVAYAFRRVFRPVTSWGYGIIAIVALMHDVLIVMGVFAVLGRYMGIEVDIPFIVALLTILGYSVNDTIVVFDRVRELLIKRGGEDFEEIVNMGVNRTLLRSVNTSFTTLLALFSLFLFGGASIHYFSLALIIGIVAGTYSSIFLASPLLVVWQKFGKKI